MAKKDSGLFHAIHHMRVGGLHRALHVDPNDKISDEKLAAGAKSSNPHIRRMVAFAHTLKGLHKH